MGIVTKYLYYCLIVWVIFTLDLAIYFYWDSVFFKKKMKYKRIVKKLDLRIENAVMNRCYKVAEKNYKKLEKVKRIWKGE